MRTRSLFGGLLLVYFGLLFLLVNLGLVPGSVWHSLTRFWPVLLVILGITMVWNRPGVAIVATVAALVLVTLAVFSSGGIDGWLPQRNYSLREWRHTLAAEVKAAELDLTGGGGKLNINSSGSRDVTGHFQGWPAPEPQFREQGDRARFEFAPNSLTAAGGDWDIAISPQVVWDLQLAMGAADADLDLRQISLSRLRLEMGAGDLNLRLGPPAEQVKVQIDAGAASLDLSLPGGTAASFDLDSVIGSSNLTGLGLNRKGDLWVTPGYDEAASRYEVSLNSAVGDFRVSFD